MNIKNYYKILEINQNATSEDIIKAFRKLALFWHPDKNSNPIATEKMQEINEAYEILSDKNKREIYDKIYMDLFINILPSIHNDNLNQDFYQHQKNVDKKWEKEIIELNNWLKNIKFSINKIDQLLEKSLRKIDKPIENFFYILPFIIIVVLIIFIIIVNTSS